MDRRTLLLAAGGTLLAGSPRADPVVTVIPLWPGLPPGGGGPSGAEVVSAKGAVSRIGVPALEVFGPDQPNGAAVLIAAGGGYRRIQMENEARPAARWLAARGITAFVLAYRLPEEGWAEGARAPLQDARRALRLIRARAARDRLDPERIGVLGFSAGGHLLGLAATGAAFAAYPPVDAADALSAEPNGAALIYPVITLVPPLDRTVTRRVLVGSRPAPATSAEWSVETHVRAGCPPMFLVQAEDDPISDSDNTRMMAEACRRAGVPVELHRLASGGHGFGMGRAGTPSAAWPSWYEAWLRRAGMLA
ncbi:alpha/beta hydrolase [Methylobacterium sp. J-068]|uniref:alpha/beta hydrolase n=1 Tax=Methylobacterium sp. J-068 TaxID=2836649 RepID=UPI001FBB13C0|nr:alpha/beta hydrolase [Methylobacterium sp. J-068]MCJ2036818.1 alpha/beta hydrolase [Methylobacterium sp. J-068]